jgi:NlpC/P60 family putative phage cell wall peptidase
MTQGAVNEARRWLGTPFLLGASLVGFGCDCAGLIEGVARSLGVAYPSRQAVEHNIVAAAGSFLVQADRIEVGALILLSREPLGVPVHAALISDANTLIHAHWRAGVVENRFGGWFERRVTQIFHWPDTHKIGDK